MDYTKITLGELLSSTNEVIRRNATSILKQLQREEVKKIEVKSESIETGFQAYQKICKHIWYYPYVNEDEQRCSICGLSKDK